MKKIIVLFFLLMLKIYSFNINSLEEPESDTLFKILDIKDDSIRFQKLKDLTSTNNEAYYYVIYELIQNQDDKNIINVFKLWQNKNEIDNTKAFIIGSYYLIQKNKFINQIYRLLRIANKNNELKEYISFLRGLVLYKKKMKIAGYNIIKQQRQYFETNQDFFYFKDAGEIAYELNYLKDAIDFLSLAYSIKNDYGIKTLLDMAISKKGLTKNEEEKLFNRVFKKNLEDAIDFSLVDLDGNIWHLKELSGKFVLLSFWASWCGPCRVELPLIEKLYREKIEDLQILAINIEGSKEKALKIKKMLNLSMPILLDSGKVVQRFYNVSSIPRTFLITPDQKIILKVIGSYKDIIGAVKDRMNLYKK